MSRELVTELTGLVPVLANTPGMPELLAALHSGDVGIIDGAWGSSSALTVSTLAAHCPATVMVLLPRASDLDDILDDLTSFCGQTPELFPAWETLPQTLSPSDSVFGKRLSLIGRLLSPQPPKLVVTTIAALLQPTPSAEEIAASTRRIGVGDELDQDELQSWLLERGFEKVTGLQMPGEFATRGGIVDLFPPNLDEPVRVEFFGDEIESIRQFDPETQRTTRSLDAIELVLVTSGSTDTTNPISPRPGTPGRGVGGEGSTEQPPTKGSKKKVSKKADSEVSGSGDSEPLTPSPSPRNTGARGASDGQRDSKNPLGSTCFADLLPAQSWVTLIDLQDITSEGRHYLERLRDPRGLFSVNSVLERCQQRPLVTISPLAAGGGRYQCHLQVESVERFSGARAEVLNELADVLGKNERVLIACHNEAEQARLKEIFQQADPTLSKRVTLCIGRVARGFRLVPQGLVVIGDNELFNRHEVRRSGKARKWETRALDSFLELSDGDYVVHLSYGIARFHGMTVMRSQDQMEEHLELEFRNNVRLFVPATLIQLVQKYVGGGKTGPELSLYGGTAWEKKKQRVTEAVEDLAQDMVVLQAKRNAMPGFACPPDTPLIKEFDDAFPYQPTPDQVTAIAACKSDLERPRPMDRLICGDVGYGKTEVAMRAAFKAIAAGRQVAVLVPTTVLAEQHYRTFGERMAEFPVTVESLSRFKTKGEQARTVRQLAEGTIDVVIGTHRLVSKDVKFKDLGLVVIDEEQRFGVDIKERLKHLRLEVDVLTLSATPIPRTLHMSLLGIRDISNLTTPPQDRQAVTTRVVRWDGDLIRQAFVRELNRNGQIFFVHNRIFDIHDIVAKLQQIVPEARFDVGHGQMSGDELEGAMLRFVRGQTDVLVCTTIIESGVDIPNANTIFIHQAENYGLADLHQLRGRVGRYKHRAYCYLLVEEGRSLTDQSAKRLKAIEEFSELGAGFKIAMRDLEIRGAGNILGTEQSGHIATVGYELYCQLLENAVKGMKKEPIKEITHVDVNLQIPAFFPSNYVLPGKHKIEVYRRLATLETLEQLRDFEAELRDRFGPLPEEARWLLELQEIQILARGWSFKHIFVKGDFVVMGYSDRRYMNLLKSRMGNRLRIVDLEQRAYLVLDRAPTDHLALVALLKKVLQPFSG